MKILYLYVFTLLFFAVNSEANTLSISQKVTLDAYSVCEQTIRAYPKLRDNGPVADYGVLFASHALFEVKKLGISLKGRQQIEDRLTEALATTKTHHVVTDVQLSLLDDETYQAKSFFTLTLLKLTQPESPAMNITGHYNDLLSFDGKRCEIVSRQVNLDPQRHNKGR